MRQTMERHRGHAGVQAQGCGVLLNLAANDDNLEALGKEAVWQVHHICLCGAHAVRRMD